MTDLRWLGSLDFGRITVPMRIAACPGSRCKPNWHALEGVVDTAATTLGLPEDVVQRLGLVPTGFREARTAAGMRRLPYIAELELEVLGRSMRSDAVVTPAGGMPLVGHKQLAELNLLIDARKGEVRVGVGAAVESFAPTKSLADVVPAVRPRFEALLVQAKAWGMQPVIRSAGRTCEEQNYQKEAGYSQASMCRSMHVMGHAIDLNLVPSTCATYTKLGQWWESQGGVWGGRWTQFGACGDAGHFHYGFDKAQAVPESVCASGLSLEQCREVRRKYLEQQQGVAPSTGGSTGTSPWSLAAWAAVLGAGYLIFRGTLNVKPGSRARLVSNPAPYEYGLTLRPVSRATVPTGFVGFRKDAKYPHGVVQYEKPLRRVDVEHFDLEPLDPLDPINVKKRYSVFKEKVLDEFSRKDIYIVEQPDGSKSSLTYSTRRGVDYQLTHWDANEQPLGHIDLNDFDEAVRLLWGDHLRARKSIKEK